MSGDTVATLFNDPRTLGPLPDADVSGQAGVPGEGPFMTMHLKLDGDTIREARFESYGCPYAVACGSYVTRWLPGRSTDQALVLEPADLNLLVGGLPLGKEHCADLAVKTLRNALALWRERQRP